MVWYTNGRIPEQGIDVRIRKSVRPHKRRVCGCVGVAWQFQYLGSGGVPPSGVDIDNGVANSVVFVNKNIFRHTLGIGDYITGRSASRVVGICLPHAKPRNGNGMIGTFTFDITLYIIGITNSSADLEHVRVGPESVEIVPASVIPIRIVVPG